ncbi:MULTISPECIES: hypothetical protein [Haloferax]|uniref:hypothetical protein n=1 Tax=Haloferax TaxID=2251 RepID=UPI001CDA22C6|nr:MULTISPECIES: hypothetical protein [Haloferax]
MSRRIAVLAVAATVLLATLGAPLALASPASPVAPAFASDSGAESADGSNAANQSTAANETPPGQKLAGVIGVQASETDGELERRTFETRLAKANSNASKAAVVAGQVETISERLTDLEQRKDRLDAAYENGTLSENQYRVQMTRVVADIERTKSMLNRTADAATTLPAPALEARGVDTAQLDSLRQSAADLTGPEVAALARDVAGENPGKGLEKAKEERNKDDDKSDDNRKGGDSDTSAGTASGNSSEKRSDNAGSSSDRGNPDTPTADERGNGGTDETSQVMIGRWSIVG